MWSGFPVCARVVPSWPGWPPLGLADVPRWLRVRFRVALFLARPSLAGGLELVVLSRGGATLEVGYALAQAGVLPLERVILLDQGRAQAQQPLAPFPDGFDGRQGQGLWREKVLQAREGLLVEGEVRVPGRHAHGFSASTAMIAASTARRSPAGMAS